MKNNDHRKGAEDAEDFIFLLSADPGGIGSAPMKYASHFIGQAFHRAGTPGKQKSSA
jgi:hypothetical protein